MKSFDVVCLGEALMDFIPLNHKNTWEFEAVPGGAPTNVAVGLAKLNNSVALISRVGEDALGSKILSKINNLGVESKWIQVDPKKLTSVSVVTPSAEDMMRFTIYRENGSDSAISISEIPKELLTNTHILHVGTLLMSSSLSKNTTLESIKIAKGNDVLISLDVNLRPSVWFSKDEMVKSAHKLIELSDIVKLTKDELNLLQVDPFILLKNNVKIVLVTDGKNGAEIYSDKSHIARPSPMVRVEDVTGAGDAFMAAFLHACLFFGVDTLELMGQNKLIRSLEFAIKAGSLTVQKKGAIDSLPTLDELEGILD